jgi:NCAIR mutase (PurE)-related protein
MDETSLRAILEDVSAGTLEPDEAARRLSRLPFADLGFAKVDHHRPLRQGLPEAVYGPGKTPDQCAAIVRELLDEPGAGPVLLTRADAEQVRAALRRSPGADVTASDGTDPARSLSGEGHEATATRGRRFTAAWRHAPFRPGRVPVVTAGTADLPVAMECTATLRAHGLRPELLADCGVAGVHRLLASADELAAADAVVVVAGMEGALASVVGGVTAAPVVAVPTSVGYGASLEGITALLAMHASCAAGVTVVGIDNGFGAACAVARMLA